MSQPTDEPTDHRADQQGDRSRQPAVPSFLPSPLRTRLETIQRQYAHGHDRPLLGYLTVSSTYGLGAVALGLAVRRHGADRIGTRDLALITVATHRLSRTLAKDAVTSPMRAAFTRYNGAGLPSEVNEEVAPRKEHSQVGHALGELVSCPFCLAQWVATGLVAAQLLAPTLTRHITSTLTAVAGADVLHFAYSALQRLEDRAQTSA
jgi:Protein of unknown function (DUF1360)